MAEDSNRTRTQQWWVQKHCLLYNTTNTASWYGRILQLCDPDSPHYQPMFQKVMGVLPGTEDSVLQLLPGGAFLMHAKSTWVAVCASARLDSINWQLPAGAHDVRLLVQTWMLCVLHLRLLHLRLLHLKLPSPLISRSYLSTNKHKSLRA